MQAASTPYLTAHKAVVYHCDPNATRPERVDYWGEMARQSRGRLPIKPAFSSATRFNPVCLAGGGCETMHALRLQQPARPGA
jgi:hypothetical protein